MSATTKESASTKTIFGIIAAVVAVLAIIAAVAVLDGDASADSDNADDPELITPEVPVTPPVEVPDRDDPDLITPEVPVTPPVEVPDRDNPDLITPEVPVTPGGDDPATITPEVPVTVTPPIAEFTTMWVGADTAECVGVGPQTCLLVKTDVNADYELFYDDIEGFEHVEGVSYKLAVEVTERENPAADQSSLQYTLIRILDEQHQPVTPPIAQIPDDVPGEAVALAGTAWQVTALNQYDWTETMVADSTLTVEFHDDGTVTGNAGCNTFRGTYTLDGEDLQIERLISTRKLCRPELQQQEQLFLDRLAETTGATGLRDGLYLQTDADQLMVLQAL